MRKAALVIGGASGIGAAVSHALAEQGLVIAVSDIAGDDAITTARTLSGEGHGGYLADISNEGSIFAAFDAAEGDLGPIAVLVLCAGIPGLIDNKRPTLRDTEAADWDRVMTVNARGIFLAIREMLRRRHAVPVKDGRVIAIGSMAAQNGGVNSPPSYVASKGAVLSLTKVAAHEAAQMGMTVNAVSPGAIDTAMLRRVMSPDRDAAYFSATAIGRAGRADEVAAAVSFLASPASSYVNGACIDVNGGLMMR